MLVISAVLFILCSLKHTNCVYDPLPTKCFCSLFFFEDGISFQCHLNCSARFECSLPRRCSHPLSPCVSFMCPCLTVQLQHASQFLWELSLGFQCVGEDLCLAPHLSVTYLNHAHSCYPSHCLPIFLSISAVTQQNITHFALACFTFPL